MTVLVACLLVALVTAGSGAQDSALTAQAIMARVAANQDRSDQLRADYVYHQKIHVVSRKTNGKLICEETLGYSVIPAPETTTRQLETLDGRYWHKGQYVEFHRKLDDGDNDESVDCSVAHALGADLTDEHSKDGFGKDLFPLTTEKQKDDEFNLVGEEKLQGRRVYRVSFTPKDKKDFDWAGEADIDTNDFEPVNVYTKLSRQIPAVIRALVVALPGVGFSVQYHRQPDGVWFPVTFGTEFKLRLFMFYRRLYTVSLENSGFKRTHVSSRLQLVGPVGRPK